MKTDLLNVAEKCDDEHFKIIRFKKRRFAKVITFFIVPKINDLLLNLVTLPHFEKCSSKSNDFKVIFVIKFAF